MKEEIFKESYMIVWPQDKERLLFEHDRYSIKGKYKNHPPKWAGNIKAILMCKYNTSEYVYKKLIEQNLPIILVDFYAIGHPEEGQVEDDIEYNPACDYDPVNEEWIVLPKTVAFYCDARDVVL